MTVHDDLQAIPDRVTRLELTVAELLKQFAGLRQQQIAQARHAPVAYTITEAAGILGVTRTQVYELIGADRIHPVRIGTHARRIPADEIDRLLHPTMASTDVTSPVEPRTTPEGPQTTPTPKIEAQRPI